MVRTRGNRPGVVYPLIDTAKLNGLDTEDYFRYVLDCIAGHAISRIEELRPSHTVAHMLRVSATA